MILNHTLELKHVYRFNCYQVRLEQSDGYLDYAPTRCLYYLTQL